ncbi:MAG: GNAT family N-acetyltransferase [Promethearchaeota archaeon]
MPNLNDLFLLNEDYLKRAAKIAVDAFFNDPVLVSYFPDPDSRKKGAQLLFEYEIRYTIRYGEVYAVSKNLEGFATWRPPENVYISQKRQIECGAQRIISKLGAKFIRRVSTIDHYIRKVHQEHAPFPHWFLSPIAVDPKYQGKGYASLLLRAMFERTDKEQTPIYLYTNTERNVKIYQHFGFKLIKRMELPNIAIPHWSMLREVK